MKYLGLTLLVLAFATSQLLIGGARMLFCLPVYGILAIVSVCAVVPRWRPVGKLPFGSLLTSLLFFGYIVVQTRFAPVEYLARNDLFIVLGSLMVYLLTAVFFVRAEERRFVLFGLLGLAAAQLILGAIQFREGNQYMPFAWMQRSDTWWRASGFYISPNHFAGLVEVIGLMAISMALWSKRSVLERLVMAYLGACCVIGVAISGSRGGYLALISGSVCLLVLSLWTCRYFYRGRWALIAVSTVVAATLVCAIAVSLMFQSASLQKRFFDIRDPGNMRFLLWGAALEQFHLEPIWGTGSGTYISYGRTYRDPQVQNDPVFVHNDYLHLLAEYGMVGAAGFLLFFAWHGVSSFRSIGKLARQVREMGETRGDALALHLGAMSAVSAYVVHSVVDFNLHIPANALVMAMVFGIVANPGVTQASSKWSAKVGEWTIKIALFAIGMFVLVYGVPLIRGEWYAEFTRRALLSYQLAETRALAGEAIKLDPSNPEVYFYAGEAAREMANNQTGDVPALQEEAIGMFKRGLELFPDDSRTMVKLAEAYDQAKRFDEAEEILARAYEIDPNSLYVHAYYGMHYRDQGLILEAANEFQIAKELDRDSVFKVAQIGFAEVQKVLATLPLTPQPEESESMDPEADSQAEPSDTEDPVEPPQ
ncbi:MAG: O-antigen polymerase [Chthoniobacteraceae bacterium]|nr:O-antigen polymerase [Chthoniobacteraceae bacterium]